MYLSTCLSACLSVCLYVCMCACVPWFSGQVPCILCDSTVIESFEGPWIGHEIIWRTILRQSYIYCVYNTFTFTLAWPGYSEIHLFCCTTERKSSELRMNYPFKCNFLYICIYIYISIIRPVHSCSVNSPSRSSAALDGLRVLCIREERPVSEQAH